MVKLNQIVAVVNGKKTEAQKELTNIYRKCDSSTLFNGLSRVYSPLDEMGEVLPAEHKKVEYTVDEAMTEFKTVMSDLMDVIACQDYNNSKAVADIVVDNKVLLEKVPVTYLLFLEKQFTDLHTFLSKLPTLDSSESWEKDSNTGLSVSEEAKTNRTKKTLCHKILVEATKEHPAQVEKWHEDVVVGTWRVKKFSGAISATERKKLTDKVKKLQEAVKFARETANQAEVDLVKVGDKVFNYLFDK